MRKRNNVWSEPKKLDRSKKNKGLAGPSRALDFWTFLNVSLFHLNIQYPKVSRAGRYAAETLRYWTDEDQAQVQKDQGI